MVGDKIMREYRTKLFSTKDLLVWDDRKLLVWNHRLNHCYFKSLLRLYKRVIILRNTSKAIRLTPCVS